MQRNYLLIWLSILLVPLLIATVWVNWPEKKRGSAGPPKVLQCTECAHERPYTPILDGKECEKCHRGKLQPGAGTPEGGATLPFYRNPLSLGLVSVTALLSLVHVCLLLRATRPWSRPSSDEQYLVCRCRKCKRRVRYAPRPVARTVLCPTCRTEIVLPPVVPGHA